jgi:large subunit ribosomal protein L4
MYNMKGEPQGELEVAPESLGGRVRTQLLKQAIVTHLDRQRQDSARTKGRGEVVGSTRKLYRQKGTGNARVGNIRTPTRRGGGRTFAKRGPRAFKEMPKKMRRLARDSALLAKIKANDVLIVTDLACSEPKTKTIAGMLSALGVAGGCVLATESHDRHVLLSGRNIAGMQVRVAQDLSAYDLLRGRKLIVSKPAFDGIVTGSKGLQE